MYDAYSSGNQIDTDRTVTGVPISDGFFNVTQLDFGSGAFNGETRFLQIEVRCPAGSGEYTMLIPRQMIMAAPVAMSLQGLYTRWNSTSPNIIGGYNGNLISGGVVGGTISGGGNNSEPNEVSNDYTTISGGSGNTINAAWATIGGGMTNVIDSSATYGVIGGGANNQISGTNQNTISGGRSNYIEGDANTISGGSNNSSYAPDNGFIGGGWQNTTSGSFSAITGGVTNTIEITGTYASIGGGQGNTVSGLGATIPGGVNNAATGDYSFAAGKNAKANHDGSFVWSDSRFDEDFESLRDYQFRVQAAGGAQFQDGDGNWIDFLWGDMIRTSSGASLSPGGTWTNASDVNLKQNFEPVDSQAILDQLAKMPNQSWNYKAESAEVRHVGPTAQDFYAAFGLGGSNTSISTVDADGISLAAIQGLYEITQDQATTIETLQAENANLESRIAALETKNNQDSTQAAVIPWVLSGILGLIFFLERFVFKRSNSYLCSDQ